MNEKTFRNEYSLSRYVCGVLIMELSRVVVLASGPVKGNTVSQLIDNQTLLLREVHLDGQGRFTRVVAKTRRLPMAKWC
jgi:hypothetical protein